MVFTDPPYNVSIGEVTGLGKTKHREFVMASGEMSKAEFTSFLKRVLECLVQASADGSIHFTCMDWAHLHELLEAGRAVYDELKNIICWTKTNGGMGSLYRSQHELIPVWKKGKGPHQNNVQLGKYGRYRSNVWTYHSEPAKLLDEGRPGSGVLDQERRGTVLLSQRLGALLELWVVVASPLHVQKVIAPVLEQPGGTGAPIVLGPAF
jgi:hypothetical protein